MYHYLALWSSPVDGASLMEAGWRSYFAVCPDYSIRKDLAIGEGETMLVAGEAGGG